MDEAPGKGQPPAFPGPSECRRGNPSDHPSYFNRPQIEDPQGYVVEKWNTHGSLPIVATKADEDSKGKIQDRVNTADHPEAKQIYVRQDSMPMLLPPNHGDYEDFKRLGVDHGPIYPHGLKHMANFTPAEVIHMPESFSSWPEAPPLFGNGPQNEPFHDETDRQDISKTRMRCLNRRESFWDHTRLLLADLSTEDSRDYDILNISLKDVEDRPFNQHDGRQKDAAVPGYLGHKVDTSDRISYLSHEPTEIADDFDSPKDSSSLELPDHELFQHEAVYYRKDPHFGSLIRHKMAPFLAYVETARNQQNPPPHKKLPGSNELNYSIIENWINICNTKHDGHCLKPNSTISSEEICPIWLIDIQNERLVSAPQGAQYMALSYVWGQKKLTSSSTTISNLGKLREKGAFGRDSVQVSNTITQVIKLARQLMIPFLWVDRFCIIQDDPAKQTQFDAMARIYAGAYVTVVAAQGESADAGLYDLISPTEVDITKRKGVFDRIYGSKKDKVAFRRTEARQPADIESWKHDRVMEWYSINLARSKWSSRGWTLQEQFFSRRKIIFQDSTVNWECHCACWQEGQGIFGSEDQVSCSTGPHVSLISLSPVPDMYRYARLISRYNQRELTFADDAIDAFAGVLSDLSRVFKGSFVSGLPVFCFDAALIWQQWGPMTKRFKDSSSDPKDLASWSWVGWQCDINSESLRSAYGYVRANVDEFSFGDWFPTSWHTFPTVDWYYSDTINSEKRRIDRFLPPNIAIDAQKEDYSPPTGWQKHRCLRSSKFYYRAIPGGDGYWYPIPLPSPSQAPLPVNRSRYLHCRTRRAFLCAETKSALRHLSSTCMSINLLAPDSTTAIGILRLHKGWKEQKFPTEKCEIIELSAGEVADQPTEEVSFDEWERAWCTRKGGRYEFYNVMWVERNGEDICFRAAVGRVLRSAWEGLMVEEVDVTLA